MKKKSLSQRTLIKRTKAVVEATRAPLICAKITLADGATVETSAEPIAILIDALGDKGVEWHTKYMEKYDKLTKQCSDELQKLIAEAVKEKNNEKN